MNKKIVLIYKTDKNKHISNILIYIYKKIQKTTKLRKLTKIKMKNIKITNPKY